MTLLGSLLVLLAFGYAAAFVAMRIGFDRALRDSVDGGFGPGEPGSTPMVSVVIAVRDEEDHIRACLESILACKWPSDRLEILVVDDGSVDGTAGIVHTVVQSHPTVRLVRLAEVPDMGRSRKKAALTEGVRQARGSHILQTDGDCRVPPGWIRAMISAFGPETGFVAGGVMLEGGTGYWSSFLKLEFAGFMGVAAGTIGLGHPVMCSGASMAWRRVVFDELGGHADLERFSSGDDDLFMQRIADRTRWKVRFCPEATATVWTRPPGSMSEFLAQRRRWASKGAHYDRGWLVATNAAIWLFYFLLLGGALAAIWVPALRLPVLVAAVLKFFAEELLLKRAVRFFGIPRLLRFHLPTQPIHLFYLLWAGWAGFRGNLTWKSRNVAR